MLTRIISSGFGGQGVLTMGMLLAYAGHYNGQKITWYPSYGSEMRGGTANCTVKISDEDIASPYVKDLDILLTLNEPAINKFEKQLVPDGYLLVNDSMVNPERIYRNDIQVVKVDTEKLAEQANNPKGANIVMIGAMLKKTGLFTFDEYETAMRTYFTDRGKEAFNDANKAALKAGFDAV